MQDLDLWLLALDGDADSFGLLFERHAGAVRNFCFRRTGDWAGSEDLCSIVFLESWRRRGEVHPESKSLRPWLFGVAVNVLRNASRLRTNHARKLERLHARLSDVPDIADEVAERIDDEADVARARQALARLNPEDQEVVTLHFWADLTYAEIAEAMRIPIGTVRSRLHRAKAKLRELTTTSEHEGLDEGHITSPTSGGGNP